MEEFERRDVTVQAVGVGPVPTHTAWIKDTDGTRRPASSFRSGATRTARSRPCTTRSIRDKATHPRCARCSSSTQKSDPRHTELPGPHRRRFRRDLPDHRLTATDLYRGARPTNWRRGDAVVISRAIKDEAALAAAFPKGYKGIGRTCA